MIDFEAEHSGNLHLHCQFSEYMSDQINIHNSFEFVYIYDGHYRVSINEKKYDLTANNAVLILPGQVHYFETIIPFSNSDDGNRNTKPFLCIFSPDIVKDFSKYIQNYSLVSPVFSLPDNRVCQFMFNTKNQYIQTAFLYLVCGLAVEKGVEQRKQPENENLIYKIVDYIDKNNIGVLTLKQMAADLNYNYTYFSSCFNKYFGTGFSNFVNEFRINYSKNLLTETNYPIAYISSECGFQTIRSFNRAFVQKEKMSPTEYRARHTKTKNT